MKDNAKRALKLRTKNFLGHIAECPTCRASGDTPILCASGQIILARLLTACEVMDGRW